MKYKLSTTILVILLSCSTVAKAQDVNQLLQNINTALTAGDCDRAQRNYNAWKEVTNRSDSSIERHIVECRSRRNVTNCQQGVVINGVCWATRNVDRPGTFTADPANSGMLYQWNRRIGWAVTGNVSDWNNTPAIGNIWEKVNDPCPSGWRVPTPAELESLLNRSNKRVGWIRTCIGDKCSSERKITDTISGNTIVLPGVGRREPDGKLSLNDGSINYWSNIDGSFLHIGSIGEGILHQTRGINGFLVRCVAE